MIEVSEKRVTEKMCRSHFIQSLFQ